MARAALGTTFALSGIVLTSWKRPQRMSDEGFTRALMFAFAAVRLGLFVAIFFVLHLAARGDVPSYYVPQGDMANHHMLIYRDFESSYAPLHPFLDGLVLRIWHTPLAIILMAIAIEIATLPLWLRLARRFAPEHVVRVAALLFLVSPISIQFVTVDGQNNVIIAALVALSLWMLLQGKEFLSGLILGASICLVKFLPLLYAPAYLLCSPRRWRLVVGGSAILAAVYGAFALLHAPILMPLTLEGNIRGAGNFGYVLESIVGVVFPNQVLDGLLLAAIVPIFALIAALIAKQAGSLSPVARVRLLTFGVTALTLTLLALSKKSWPTYLVLTLFPMCLTVADGGVGLGRLRLVLFSLFEIVSVTEHSVWETVRGEVHSIPLHMELMAHSRSGIGFFLLEVLLVGGYFWLLSEAVRRMIATRQWMESGANA
jgi:hypothetical protein